MDIITSCNDIKQRLSRIKLFVLFSLEHQSRLRRFETTKKQLNFSIHFRSMAQLSINCVSMSVSLLLALSTFEREMKWKWNTHAQRIERQLSQLANMNWKPELFFSDTLFSQNCQIFTALEENKSDFVRLFLKQNIDLLESEELNNRIVKLFNSSTSPIFPDQDWKTFEEKIKCLLIIHFLFVKKLILSLWIDYNYPKFSHPSTTLDNLWTFSSVYKDSRCCWINNKTKISCFGQKRFILRHWRII